MREQNDLITLVLEGVLDASGLRDAVAAEWRGTEGRLRRADLEGRPATKQLLDWMDDALRRCTREAPVEFLLGYIAAVREG